MQCLKREKKIMAKDLNFSEFRHARSQLDVQVLDFATEKEIAKHNVRKKT